MDGEPQDYTGEDLFLYIDGGAEIYREYGFAEVLIQDYKGPEGKRLSLEIFRMTSPEAAFGMYTFKRSPKGTPVEAGAEGQLEGYYLNLWKGRFLVTITGQDEGPATRRGLLELARAVAEKIPGPSSPAPIVNRLPQSALIKTSVRYFKGYLGFMNVYPSLGAKAFVFEEGVRADYSSGASLFILEYSSEGSLRRGFAGIEKSLREDLGSKRVPGWPRPFFSSDRWQRKAPEPSGRRPVSVALHRRPDPGEERPWAFCAGSNRPWRAIPLIEPAGDVGPRRGRFDETGGHHGGETLVDRQHRYGERKPLSAAPAVGLPVSVFHGAVVIGICGALEKGLHEVDGVVEVPVVHVARIDVDLALSFGPSVFQSRSRM